MSLWTKLSIWTPWTVSPALEPYCPLNLAIYPIFYNRDTTKHHERQYGLIHVVLSQHCYQSSKDTTVWPILPSQGFFIKFHQKLVLFLFQASFEKYESGTIRIDPYCPFRKIWSAIIKDTYDSLLCFFCKFWPRGNAVWHICLFQGSNTNSQITSYISSCSQTFIKKLFAGQFGLTHIVLSRALYEFPSKLVLKCLLKKLHLGHCGLIHIVLPRILNLYKFPSKAFFLILKSVFKKLYQGQYVLTYIIFSRI